MELFTHQNTHLNISVNVHPDVAKNFAQEPKLWRTFTLKVVGAKITQDRANEVLVGIGPLTLQHSDLWSWTLRTSQKSRGSTDWPGGIVCSFTAEPAKIEVLDHRSSTLGSRGLPNDLAKEILSKVQDTLLALKRTAP